jgi:hypothetical protein
MMDVMRSMRLDEEEQLDAVLPIAMDKPEFPPELCICLTDKTLEKLGLDPQAAAGQIGGLVEIRAMARITSANIREDCARVELQIEDMCVESEDDDEPRRSLKYTT